MVWTMLQGMVAHAIQGYDFNRRGSDLQLGPITLKLVYECSDGYVVLFPIGEALARLVGWCVEEGLIPEHWLTDENWPMYHLKVLQQDPLSHTIDEIIEAVGRYVRDKTKSQLLEQSLREGVSMAPVSTTEELARFHHLEERGYWLTAPLPNGQQIPVPGLFARAAATPMAVRRWAPKLGEHNHEVLGQMLGLSPEQAAAAAGLTRR
jgi:crotonobetainyl-CoA:carnitine CoA-transferase CaiB-like acyl-CoA transferase